MADSNNFNISGAMWEAFINFVYATKLLEVPNEFHAQCEEIQTMLENDITGIISTILDYAVNSAVEAKFKVECEKSETLENILTIWLKQINIRVDGIPTGLQELAREYYKERWQGSSLCLLKIGDWKDISINNTKVSLPTTLWFVNSASVYIDRPKGAFKLGTDKYYYDGKFEKPIIKSNEDYVIQKSGSARWFTKYPIPYTIRKGIYKNYKAIELLQSKGDEVVAKVIPYLFEITKGDIQMWMKGSKYSTKELKDLNEDFKTAAKKYKNEKRRVPSVAKSFDEKHEHLIPDISNMIKEELFRQGYRNILAGLGFVDMLEISPSRQETRLNPKPFIAELNDGVTGFKNLLLEVIYLIVSENKELHKKYFSDLSKIKIINTPLKVNVESIMDYLNRGYIYGTITIESYHEILGLDHEQEVSRMKKEWDTGLRELFYAHVIQNMEDRGIDTQISAPPITKKQNEKNDKKIQQASEELLVKCKKCGHEFDLLSIAESGMGYVKCPKCEEAVTQEDLIIAPYKNVEELLKKHPYMKKYPKGALEVFVTVFNKSLPKGEDYAFPVAYTAMKRWLKKHGYKKVGDKWVKSTEENK